MSEQTLIFCVRRNRSFDTDIPDTYSTYAFVSHFSISIRTYVVLQFSVFVRKLKESMAELMENYQQKVIQHIY